MEKIFKNLLERFNDVKVRKGDGLFSLVETLKNIPRSGKSTRIDKHNLSLPKRSVYDHINSLPVQADFFFSLRPINNLDKPDLAALLVCHDLVEALTGDVPDFTSQDIAGLTFKTKQEKIDSEKAARKKISASLTRELKSVYDGAAKNAEEKESDLYKFFYMIDKTDPIIAIWRYIYLLKGEIDIDKFLEAMSDFFTFPEAQNCCVNPKSLSIIKILQTPENAKEYHSKGNRIIQKFFPDNSRDIIDLIEKRPMDFIK